MLPYIQFSNYVSWVYSGFYIRYDMLLPHHGPSAGGRTHVHNTSEFVLVTNGRSLITIDREQYQAEGSYLIYYPQRVPHRQLNDAARYYSRYVISIDPSYFIGNVSLPEQGFVLPLKEFELAPFLGPTKLLCEYFAGFEGDYTPLQKQRRDCLLRLFLAETDALLKKGQFCSANSCGQYITELLHYIDEHAAKPPSLSELSAIFHVSQSKLSRDFRAETGMSVGDYIAVARIHLAQYHLRTGLSVAETAEAGGFSGSANFIHFFKQHTSQTPTEYRRSNEAKDFG